MTETLCEICQGKVHKDAIFVFGSNEMGIHGAGAAYHARNYHDAEPSVGWGPRGFSFAIPTKDWKVETLPLDAIRAYVNSFIRYAKICSGALFYVTRIGCGFAGYTDADIGPMFINAPLNCILPDEFQKAIQNKLLTERGALDMIVT